MGQRIEGETMNDIRDVMLCHCDAVTLQYSVPVNFTDRMLTELSSIKKVVIKSCVKCALKPVCYLYVAKASPVRRTAERYIFIFTMRSVTDNCPGQIVDIMLGTITSNRSNF